MGIVKNLSRLITSWYNEVEADRKEQRTDAVLSRAVKAEAEANDLIASYRIADKAYSNRQHRRY